ncbi:succinate-semialdehyde dehydrogenase/glutarate-semialdehyde dehydrogenase [Aminobacter niigataensis]|uniref:Succinate-semialdehyde dehydrogenase/glutarate-semialdehyde dehydrogenase n=1 Tax=Aminobacter niigataensis TaxID=83265 RepID=A0ABR6KX63_9HYPH|nr:NAD-dependent succinate-semialdehyde dehydrogenase [Aminobacter niigataensis]MBB4648524.1 succinate-semialdehyde dehydrogenase/glutarate-semialdehyde dehydrogenase [Aminobacter niigataensis]
MQISDVRLFIGGEWRKTKETLPVINPADEQMIGTVAVAETSDLEAAVSAAAEGFRVWSRTSPAERARIMLKAAALMRERIEEIALSITLENGKTLNEARLEVIRGCEFFEWDAGEAVRFYGRVIPSAPGIRYIVLHEPIGPVAGFAPWNFPMSQPARKIAGALAAGCSIILKSSEETPTGATHIARAFVDAGLPAGVLNLVYGIPSRISEFLIPRPEIRAIAFTGSTPVGKHLTELAARYMKPALMELGGHAPVVVCEDADPVAAGIASASRKYRNAGQVCTSPTRFFVHEALYDRFVTAFTETAAKVRVGNGLDPETTMGPVANNRRIAALEELVADAQSRGARLLFGGSRLKNNGYFFPPTALADLPDDARVMREEPFGPLAVINPVVSIDEAIDKANSLPFGLAAYGFTNSVANADRLMSGLEAGNISINTLEASVAETPFGGVKESGLGREGGTEGLHHYTVVKNVSCRIL